ncbi:MAG: molybdopterin biosynthesis protein [Deltaproteobacteria bacterium]|nr:MAG: molybdopterin biosynthesis protein [Deltaproteobacteria bacterium]
MARRIYLKMKSLAEARDLFLNHWDLANLLSSETISTIEAAGRVTAEPVFARFSVPTFHAAAMDGISVRAESTFGATPEHPLHLKLGTDANWINTGQGMPQGADAVVMVENLHQVDDHTVEIQSGAFPWQHVRKIGEDIVATELLLPQNHQITAYDLGALLGAGVLEVEVKRRPSVLVIPTGDELVEAEKLKGAESPPPDRVVEFNSWVLVNLVRQWGGICRRHPIVRDDPEQLRQILLQAVQGEYDLVIINAGSSAGSEDYTVNLVEGLGTMLVHGVAIMPGKPTVLGEIQGKPVIGNPGYPVSAVISMEQFVRPFLYRIQGLAEPESEQVEAYPSQKLPSKLGVEEFLRVNLGRVGDRLVATPLPRGAGSITSLNQATGFLRIPDTVEGVTDDEPHPVTLLASKQSIERTLVAVGSHDMTLDVITNLLKKYHPEVSLASSNVGSLGGLLALRKGTAHLAGSHLLDTDTGEYNTTYIQRYLPGLEVHLVNLVYREQGLIVTPGNPRCISGLKDLSRPELTFVNRQAGSGTRILLDWQLTQLGVDPAGINGYEREEYTHMAVAADVLSGTADSGMAIYAAAQALKLDFIPVITERYDLVIPAIHFETPLIQALLEVIASREFKNQVMALGGYDVRDTGRLIPTVVDEVEIS